MEKQTPIEMILEELCTRYGLDREQINVKIDVYNLDDTNLAQQIVNDYTCKDYLIKNSKDLEEHHYTYVTNFNQRFDVGASTKKGVFKDALPLR